MREIKFRQWQPETRKFLYIYNMQVGDTVKVEHILHPGELEQYSGINDINNNEIYEGDHVICAFDDSIGRHGKVYWSEAHAAFKVDSLYCRRFLKDAQAIEIIGNIHENQPPSNG